MVRPGVRGGVARGGQPLAGVLTVDHFLNDTDADLLFEPLLQARQIAERVHDQQGIADALSLLGQAYYFVALMARARSGTSPNSPQDQGQYDEALAMANEQLERLNRQ